MPRYEGKNACAQCDGSLKTVDYEIGSLRFCSATCVAKWQLAMQRYQMSLQLQPVCVQEGDECACHRCRDP